MRKWLFRFFVIFLLYVLFRTAWAVDRLESNQLILKNCFEEVKAKHNKLKEIVRLFHDRD
jgi:hypothetical protein